MSILKWALLLVCTPAVLSAYISQRSGYHETCTSDKDCTPRRMYCQLIQGIKRCECVKGFAAKNGECFLAKRVGDICGDTMGICITENSHCEKGGLTNLCTCDPGYSNVGAECLLNKLGHKCWDHTDCPIPNSECKMFKCTCKEYYFDLKGQCVPGLHATCDWRNDCKAENTECIFDKCQCESKSVETPETKCRLISNHHEECKYDVQCSTGLDNTFCNTTSELCECKAKYHFKNNKCHQDRLVDEWCTVTDECVTLNTHCDEKCNCNEGYKQAGNQCVLKKLEDDCTKNTECIYDNSKCKNKKCSCRDNYFNQDGQCVAGLDAWCSFSVHCKTPNAECSETEHRCKCQSDHVAVADNECMPKSKHNDTCVYNEQCSKTVPHTTCKDMGMGDKRCICKDGYLFQKDKCYAKKSLGDKCTAKSDVCTPDNSDCEYGTCECIMGYHKDGEKCAVNELGTACDEDGDCNEVIDHSRCHWGTCDCNEYYFPQKGQCLAGLNAECKTDGECHAKNTECQVSEGKCKCTSTHVATRENECLPKLQYDETCIDNVQCSATAPNTICSKTVTGQQRCACNDAYYFKDNECHPKKYAGEVCAVEDDCFALKSHCVDKKCKCDLGYKQDKKRCVLNQLGDECAKDIECPFENEKCTNKKCACKEKFHFKNDKCHPDRSVDEECRVTDECVTSNTHCDKKCKCDVGYKLVDKTCVINQFGDECAKDEDCTYGNSKCTDKKCACKDNFINQGGKCVAGLNAECKKHEECIATDSECRDGTCQCKPKLVGTPTNECLPISQHKKECKHDLQCSAGLAHTFCNSTKAAAKEVCECEEAYLFQKDKCYQKKWLSEKCAVKNDVCVTINSDCNDGKCQCLPDFPKIIDGVCSSSIIIRPLFSVVAIVLLALKVMF